VAVYFSFFTGKLSNLLLNQFKTLFLVGFWRNSLTIHRLRVNLGTFLQIKCVKIVLRQLIRCLTGVEKAIYPLNFLSHLVSDTRTNLSYLIHYIVMFVTVSRFCFIRLLHNQPELMWL